MAVVIVTSRLGQLLLVLLVTLLLFDQVGLVSSEEEEDSSADNIEECGEETVDCDTDLLPGQFLCLNLDIDPVTQQLQGCKVVNGEPRAPLRCKAIGQYQSIVSSLYSIPYPLRRIPDVLIVSLCLSLCLCVSVSLTFYSFL